MRKEWYWGAGKSSMNGGGGGEDKESDITSSGCICSVFQLFDFQQFRFPSHQQQSSLKAERLLPQTQPEAKDTEASRNSLELDERSAPTTIAEDESLNIQLMGIQTKTNRDTSSRVQGATNGYSPLEIGSSPSTKTPNLVARLMGLDVLPDQSYSPTFSSSNIENPNPQGNSQLHHHFRRRPFLQSKLSSHVSGLDSDFSGVLSLVETPRMSSARSSDVEHRSSLQINEENLNPNEELVLSRISLKPKELKTEDENRSPGHYARQIVKQVKERVSRKVGLDITNTVKNREQASRDELISRLKSKKMSKTKVTGDSSPGKHSITSFSPRLKFLESRNSPSFSVPSTKDHSISQSLKSSISAHSQVSVKIQKIKAPKKSKLLPVQEREYDHQHQQRPIKKCKEVAEERFGPPLRLTKKSPQSADIIPNKREEPPVLPSIAIGENIPDKRYEKTPLSNNLVPTLLLPVKKDPSPPPATKIPQKSKCSSQLSSCRSHSQKQQEALNARGSSNEGSSSGEVATTEDGGAAAAEYEYITRILRHSGIEKDRPVSFTRWFSPSHPLDPSIFYYLECFSIISPSSSSSGRYSYGQLSHRCNRKLLFHYVDELLVGILKPCMNMKPWGTSLSGSRCDFIGGTKDARGLHLIEFLYSKVRSVPCADCRVLEDIDALIDKDMPPLKLQSDVALGEEGEGIVKEIEKDLLEAIIHETAAILILW